jgi:hypothetical protein
LVEGKRVLIAGGSGVFGRLLARELLSTTSASLAIASALSSGFREPVTVRLPIGEGRTFLLGSPDRELLRRGPGIEAEFRVAFEWSLTSLLVSRLQDLPKGFLRPIGRSPIKR